LPEFVDSAIKDIDERLRTLKEEAARLEAARAALTGGPRRRGRPAAGARPRSASRQNGRSARPSPRRDGNSRAEQALEIVRRKPGVTIPEIARVMQIQPNYLYRVLPRLASAGEVKRDGQGWHSASASASASTPKRARAARAATRRRPAAVEKPAAEAPAKQKPARRRATTSAPATDGRSPRGATRASVLAALTGGEPMTATEVAAKAGLARGVVSTTLSKLAKSGQVQKAERGYRLATSG
jgi:DNA-binding IscR family transcriptional regulator